MCEFNSLLLSSALSRHLSLNLDPSLPSSLTVKQKRSSVSERCIFYTTSKLLATCFYSFNLFTQKLHWHSNWQIFLVFLPSAKEPGQEAVAKQCPLAPEQPHTLSADPQSGLSPQNSFFKPVSRCFLFISSLHFFTLLSLCCQSAFLSHVSLLSVLCLRKN